MQNDSRPDIGRRDLIKAVGAATAAALLPRNVWADQQPKHGNVPGYLKQYAKQYADDPRAAARAWFAAAKYGLFMHYGLYSQLARGEWVMLREKIPIPKYMKLKDTFTAAKFDADFITDMAIAGGMKYVNITSRHHDGFSLFETAQNDYHAKASPAKRDLIGELAEQCHKKDLATKLGADSAWVLVRTVAPIPGNAS
ncbi:MAG: alpha-L-fucosidase [Phycisphaerae bacterium]